ncbi:MAG: peptidoglycan bridge formation glycyltransferase FemA/FemB family protein [bacterium]
MRTVDIIRDSREVNEFLASQSNSSFLQTPEWASLNYQQFWMVGAREDGKLVGTLTVGSRMLPMGYRYLYCPRGPVIDNSLAIEEQRSIQADLLRWFDRDEADSFFVKHKDISFIFFRFDPLLSDFNYADFGVKTVTAVQPLATIVVELQRIEEELLADMRQKTRYNIRLGEKKGVTVRKTERPEDLARFLKLLADTAKRDKFRHHPEQHYWDLFNYGVEAKEKGKLDTALWVAEYKNSLLAGALTAVFGDTVTYLHGASDYAFRDLMAPYLLQWKIMEWGKLENKSWYDLYGITLEDDINHAWAGITRFKKGFGGETVAYPGTFDMVYDGLAYQLYSKSRMIRRLLPF